MWRMAKNDGDSGDAGKRDVETMRRFEVRRDRSQRQRRDVAWQSRRRGSMRWRAPAISDETESMERNDRFINVEKERAVTIS